MATTFFIPKLILSIIIIIAIICSIEYGIYQLLNLLFLEKSICAILGCFILNYISLRTIALHWMYEWQFPFQSFNLYYETRRTAKNLRNCFKRLKFSLLTLGDPSGVLIKSEIENIKSSFYVIDSLKNNYELCIQKFGKISSYQNNFYQYLNKLNTEMVESGFREYFQKFIVIKKHSRIKCSWQQNKNYVIDSNLKLELSKMILTLNFILEIFDNYILEQCFFFFFKFLKTLLLNDTFGSLDYYKVEFYNKFENYKIEEFTENNINYCIISNSENSINRKLFFFCGPNGGPFEFIAQKKIEFYLKKGIDVLLWNYRGYGYSKGRASFSKCKNDVLNIFDECKKKHNYNMIAVGGYSIGGVAATHLAANRKIDVLISDRNFASISKIAYCFFFGRILYFLAYFFLINNNYTIDNFMNSNCFKIILCSSTDFIIRSNGSIKTNAIIQLMNNCVKIRNREMIKCKDIFDLIFNKEEKNNFICSFIYVCDYYYAKKKSNKIFDFDSFGEEKELLNDDMNNIEQNNEITDKHLFNFFVPFLNVCCDNLNDIFEKNYSFRRKSLFVRDFFTNFILWGIQCYKFAKIKNKKDLGFYNESCKDILISCRNELNKIKNSTFQRNEILNQIIRLSDLLQNFIERLDLLEVVKINRNNKIKKTLITSDSHENLNDNSFLSEEEDKIEGYDKFCQDFNFMKKKMKLIKISCGHNGLMDDDEYEQYLDYLIESKFIEV